MGVPDLDGRPLVAGVMADLRQESASYAREVDVEAAAIVRRGEAAPWEAITRAHLIVQRRRQDEAYQKQRKATS